MIPGRRAKASRRARAGAILARALEQLGPTFIKIGQILSSRPDLLPPEIAGALARLRDRVEPMPQRHLKHALDTAFPSRNAVFDFFELSPVRSASIAQVHRARLRSGLDVAVKIRRLGLEKTFKTDLRIIASAAALIEKFPRMRSTPLRETVQEFGKTLSQQTDFRKEAESNRAFRRNLDDKDVAIPFLIDDLCGESVLVMEYVGGGLNVLGPGFPDATNRLQAGKLLRVLYQMVFVDGFIHADMHPGNVFFLEDLRVLLLDFGMVAELNDEDLNHFTEFFLGMVSNDGRRCAGIIRKTASWIDPRIPPERFDAMMEEIVARHWLELARDYEVARFGVEMFEAQRKCRIRGSTKFAMVILSFIVFEGIARALHPALDFQAEARSFIPQVLARRKQKGLLLNVV
jgi:ubiquinone biosynthesis protein